MRWKVLIVAFAAWGAVAQAQAGPSPSAIGTLQFQLDVIRRSVQVDPEQGLREAQTIAREISMIRADRKRDLLGAAAQHLIGEALIRLNRLEEGEQVVLAALATAQRIDPQSKVTADALLSKGSIDAMRGKVAGALEAYQAAYHSYRRLGEHRSEAVTLTYIASLYTEARDNASALRYSDQAISSFSSDPQLLLAMHNNRGTILQDLGRFTDADREFGLALTIARRGGRALPLAQLWGNIALNRIKAGHVREAGTAVQRALRFARIGEASTWRPPLLAIAAEVALRSGRTQEAARLIQASFGDADITRTTLPYREAHHTAYRAFQVLGRSKEALSHLIALKRLDDEATKLATTTSTALMGARFDFANQELRIAKLRGDELRRRVDAERAQAASDRLMFLIIGGATAVVIALLGFALFTVRRSRNKVAAANTGLEITNAALEKALAAKTEFLATTSHEIRTPLNGILGMTQVMLADAALPDATRERLTVVHGAGETMRALVNDILDVAKMETGNLTVENTPFDMAATLRDAAAIWEEQARAKGLAFAMHLPDAPRMVRGDAARVRQIVFNLLANAIKFTEHGAVTLSGGASHDGDVVLTVSDTGIGIPAGQHAAVFESFRQADASMTRRFGGTGLGLAICRNLTEAMGGRIALDSTPGRGSTFTVVLPLPPADGPCAQIVATGASLLVVDRNPIAQGMWRALLTPRAGTPVFAGSAEQATAMLGCGGIRHVLIDLGTAGTALDAIVAAARDAEVTLLCPPGHRSASIAGAVRVLHRPITGNAVVAAMFPGALVPRAA